MSNLLRSLRWTQEYSSVNCLIVIRCFRRCFPCGHTYCSECINGVQSTSLSTDYICPICRQKFPIRQVFPKNYSVLEAAESHCSYTHKQEPEKAKTNEEDKAAPAMCVIHPKKKIKFFCLNCEEPICSKCFTLTHIRHSLEKPLSTSTFYCRYT